MPGRSLSSSGVTTSNASLTSSLITFFSPPQELVRVTSSVEQLGYGLNRYTYVVTNFTGDEVNFDWAPGPLACNTSYCGNDVRQGEESCDGPDLGGTTCADLGYEGGILGCTSECGFDTSACTGSLCGNGVIDEGEQCDGEDLGDMTCEGLGYYGGYLLVRRGVQLRHVRLLRLLPVLRGRGRQRRGRAVRRG